MKVSISYFYNARFFQKHQIGISTAAWQPKYWKYGLNDYGAVLGICEELLSPKSIENIECQKDCPLRSQVPNCSFLRQYSAYLKTLDFNYLMSEFTRIAAEVKKINNYYGEPEIVLLVYETPDNPCSERASLISLFKEHGIEVKEWSKESIGEIF